MSKIYNDFKEGRPMRGLLKFSAIILFILVWVLIDKGNIYGQSRAVGDVISYKEAKAKPSNGSSVFKSGGGDDEDQGGDITDDGGDDGNTFTAYPNPTKGDLVFDFEFTVRTSIPFEVIDPLGRSVARGAFEPGVNQPKLDLSRFKDGLYIIRLEIGGKAKITRVVKQ